MTTTKPRPMTGAARQRKHRQKRQRELQALRAGVPATQQERESVAQVQRLAAQLDKATRTAATLQARIDALQTVERELQALREAVRAGDHVVFMSNGGFDGAPRRFLAALRDA